MLGLGLGYGAGSGTEDARESAPRVILFNPVRIWLESNRGSDFLGCGSYLGWPSHVGPGYTS